MKKTTTTPIARHSLADAVVGRLHPRIQRLVLHHPGVPVEGVGIGDPVNGWLIDDVAITGTNASRLKAVA